MKIYSLMFAAIVFGGMRVEAQSVDPTAIPEEIIPPGMVITNKVIPRGAPDNPISGRKNEIVNVGGTATNRAEVTSGRGTGAGDSKTNSKTNVVSAVRATDVLKSPVTSTNEATAAR